MQSEDRVAGSDADPAGSDIWNPDYRIIVPRVFFGPPFSIIIILIATDHLVVCDVQWWSGRVELISWSLPA